MKKSLYIALFLFILLVPFAFAKSGHIRLLAVKETTDGFNGSIADLYLEIKEGSGRVFLDTFPLTKIDTQLSTRFAKEIACDHLSEDCSNLDFFYTIRSDSSIVGGPSAGAAITFLTIALLDNMPVDETITVTGTINSGGIVGIVGGVDAKIDAASGNGLKKVLIPKGTIVKEDNKTIDLQAYAQEKGIELFEVSTIEEVIHFFTGKELEDYGNISIDKSYSEIMKSLADKLCGRGNNLKAELAKFEGEKNVSKADELYGQGLKSFEEGLHYAAASYCYGANVKYRNVLYDLENLTESAVHQIVNFAQRDISNLKAKLSKSKIETITDLETFMVVNDRIIEAERYIGQALENINGTQVSYYLAYAMERIYSAYSWNGFFIHAGRKLNLNEEALKDSCHNKIAEAEERYQYVNLFFSGSSTLKSTREGISLAYKDLQNGDYALCLFKASKAKADADVILSAFNVEEGQVDMLLQQKLDVAKRNIIRELDKDIFPVLGYSYYEYANALRDSDKYSALLYVEYALELSGLDIYFKDRLPSFRISEVHIHVLLIFVWGALVGFVLGFIIKTKVSQKKERKQKWYVLSAKRKRR